MYVNPYGWLYELVPLSLLFKNRLSHAFDQFYVKQSLSDEHALTLHSFYAHWYIFTGRMSFFMVVTPGCFSQCIPTHEKFVRYAGVRRIGCV